MKRTLLSGLFASLTFLFSAIILTGCGGGSTRDDDEEIYPARRSSRKKGGAAVAKASLKPVKATEYGVLRGKVAWEGPLPSFEEETAKLLAAISGNPDKDFCLTGKSSDGKSVPLQSCETQQQTFRIGKNNQLGNVFVWIQPEAGHFFEIPKEQLDAVPKKVTLTQPHCAFLPHAFVLFPSYRGADGKLTPTGQQFFIENDARVGHNANVRGGPIQSPENASIPAGGQPKEIFLKPDTQPVSISCNIHGWMQAWTRVYDHPYATVSSVGADPSAKKWEDLENPNVGTYEIKGVPVGAKVKIFAWHEVLGYLGNPKGEEIVLQKENVKEFTAKK